MDYEIKEIKTEEFCMEYLEFGKGEKSLVIIPGLSVTSVLKSAKEIAENYAMFREEYTVYLFDRRKDLPDNYTVYMAREDTRQAIKAAGIDKAYIFGASQGGMLTMLIAITHPEIAVKIALGSTIRYIGGTTGKSNNWYEEAEKGSIKNLSISFMESVYTNAGPMIEMAKNLPEEMFGTREDLDRFRILYKANDSYDIRDRLCEIRCPVLAIGGRKDVIAQWEESVEIAKRTGGEYYIYEEFGHAAYDEAPDYKQRLYDFFAE